MVGGALGVILGVSMVAYLTATKSRESYYDEAFIPSDDPSQLGILFSRKERMVWHSKNQLFSKNQKNKTPQLMFVTTF